MTETTHSEKDDMSKKESISLGARIRWIRKRAHLTQPELASRCGWDSQSRISMYERDVRTPSTRDLQKIASVTGGDMTWLATGDGQPFKGPSLTLDKNTYRDIVRAAPIKAYAVLDPQGGTMQPATPADDGFVLIPTEDPEPYAMTIQGDEYAPAIRDGWHVVIESHQPIHPGEYVYVVLNDGSQMFAELLWERAASLALETLGSIPERRTLQRSKVVVIQHVAGILPPSQLRQIKP